MKTYKLRTNGENFGVGNACAFDFGTFKKQGGLPKVGDLLSVSKFVKGRGFMGTETWRVDTKPFYDNRDEVQIRNNPIVGAQIRHGHAGLRIHRVVFTRITRY
tara:strand:- start:74 stop:382 length:309 start_codon:yes stop_codon:yes gene_type:complete